MTDTPEKLKKPQNLDLSDLTAADFVSACDDDPPAEAAATSAEAGTPPATMSAAPVKASTANPASGSHESGPSRFLPFQPPFGWDGVEAQPYKQGGNSFAGVVRRVLVGPGDATAYHVRYFEVAPGGYSSLEKHGHAHTVICVRGRGVSIVGTEALPMNLMDAVYVAPWAPHQFVNESEEPFGFLCIVDADRDRPQPLSDNELAKLKAHPEVARTIRLG